MQNVPVLRDTSAVLQCESHSVNLVGDHSVWYGKVVHAYTNEDVMQPLLYYAKWVLSTLLLETATFSHC